MCGPRHRTEQKRPNQWRVVVMRKRMIVFRMIFGRYNLKIPKLDTPCLTTFFEGTTRPTMATRLPDPPGQGWAGIPASIPIPWMERECNFSLPSQNSECRMEWNASKFLFGTEVVMCQKKGEVVGRGLRSHSFWDLKKHPIRITPIQI